MEYYHNNEKVMWEIRDIHKGYEPFFTWEKYGCKLIEAVEELVEEYGMPQYPGDVMDYMIRGKSLKEWMFDLKGIGSASSHYMIETADTFGCPCSDKCYYIYPIFHELIVKPKEITSKIRQQMNTESKGKDKKQQDEMLTIQTASARRGVFWVIVERGEEHLLAFPFTNGDVMGVAKSGNTYNHKKLWEHVRPQGVNKPYNYYPRGRVEITKRGYAVIYSSPHIKESFLNEIKDIFGLTGNVRLQYDFSRHYQSFYDEDWQGRLLNIF